MTLNITYLPSGVLPFPMLTTESNYLIRLRKSYLVDILDQSALLLNFKFAEKKLYQLCLCSFLFINCF